MPLPPIVFVFLMGCTAAVLSEFPSVLRDMVDGIVTFRDQLDSTPRSSRSEIDVRPMQTGFRLAGAALILVSVIAFATRF